jgi:hypothetical protein
MPAPSNAAMLSIGSLRYSAPVAMTIARAGIASPPSDLDAVRLAIARQLHRLFRDHHLCAELLRLEVGPPGEVLT